MSHRDAEFLGTIAAYILGLGDVPAPRKAAALEALYRGDTRAAISILG